MEPEILVQDLSAGKLSAVDGAFEIYVDGSNLSKPSKFYGFGAYVHGFGFAAGGCAPGGSNQIAELNAVKAGLLSFYQSFCKDGQDASNSLTIVSDSKFALSCSFIWRKGWEANGNQTHGGKPVTDLVLNIWKLVDSVENSGTAVSYRHVRGHGKDPSMSESDVSGNAAADAIATGFSALAAGRISDEDLQNSLDSLNIKYGNGMI